MIGKGVSWIGKDIIYECTSLTSIRFENSSAWYSTTKVDKWEGRTGGKLADLSDSSRNVDKLLDADKYWYRLQP